LGQEETLWRQPPRLSGLGESPAALLEFVEDRFPTKVSIVSGDGDLLDKKKSGRGWYAAPACLGGRN